jgi:hypothetical protein
MQRAVIAAIRSLMRTLSDAWHKGRTLHVERIQRSRFKDRVSLKGEEQMTFIVLAEPVP